MFPSLLGFALTPPEDGDFTLAEWGFLCLVARASFPSTSYRELDAFRRPQEAFGPIPLPPVYFKRLIEVPIVLPKTHQDKLSCNSYGWIGYQRSFAHTRSCLFNLFAKIL